MTNTPDLTAPEAVERFLHGVFVRARDYDALSAALSGLKDAYTGAMEDKRMWKRRAEAAEVELTTLNTEIDLVWEAVGSRSNRSALSPSEQVASLSNELDATEADLTTLKAELAEAVELISVSLKAVNWSFAAGSEERENGSARRQGKLLDQIRPFETDARAFLARHQKETGA